MANIAGKWQLVSSEGFIEALQMLGISAEKLEIAKRMEVTGAAGATEEYGFDGSSFSRKIIRPDGSVATEDSVKTGEWVQGTSADGRSIQLKITVNGDNETVREEKADGYEATWVRTINGNDMTVVMTHSKGGKATRKYSRV